MELVVVSVLLGWFAVSAIVVGLCVAAARGDADGIVRASRDAAGFSPGGEPAAILPAADRLPSA